MLRKTRILWKVHKPISDALFENGDRNPKSASDLLDRVDQDSFLPFSDQVKINRKRSVANAAMQILIQYMAFSIHLYGEKSFESHIFGIAMIKSNPDLADQLIAEAYKRASEL